MADQASDTSAGGFVAYRFVVSGRVQGVGFRWFAAREAARTGVAGWVTNLPSGQVEVLCRGTVTQISGFEKSLHQGPRSARVDSVDKVRHST